MDIQYYTIPPYTIRIRKDYYFGALAPFVKNLHTILKKHQCKNTRKNSFLSHFSVPQGNKVFMCSSTLQVPETGRDSHGIDPNVKSCVSKKDHVIQIKQRMFYIMGLFVLEVIIYLQTGQSRAERRLCESGTAVAQSTQRRSTDRGMKRRNETQKWKAGSTAVPGLTARPTATNKYIVE